jgi:hypothetical protein
LNYSTDVFELTVLSELLPPRLGTHLVLPPWLEPDRKSLEKVLPKVNLPSSSKTAKITEEKTII